LKMQAVRHMGRRLMCETSICGKRPLVRNTVVERKFFRTPVSRGQTIATACAIITPKKHRARSRLFIAVTGHRGLGSMRTCVATLFAAKTLRISVRRRRFEVIRSWWLRVLRPHRNVFRKWQNPNTSPDRVLVTGLFSSLGNPSRAAPIFSLNLMHRELRSASGRGAGRAEKLASFRRNVAGQISALLL